MKVTILGCGGSYGVPMIGCRCPVCTSGNPRNKRNRVSALVEAQGKKLLIDTSPDLRQQALANNISAIDAVLYTHDHADHMHGIDDLRSFNHAKGDGIPIYGDKGTLNELQKRFDYVFRPKPVPVWYRPCLYPHEIPTDPLRSFSVDNIEIIPILQLHGKTTSLGFRIGDFAYSTDMNGLPEESYEKLQGLKLWVVDCLRYTPSPTHATLEMTLAWIGRLKPQRAVLTHMGHELDYNKLLSELPAGVEPAYDGMAIEL